MDIPPTAGPALYGPGWELRLRPALLAVAMDCCTTKI